MKKQKKFTHDQWDDIGSVVGKVFALIGKLLDPETRNGEKKKERTKK